MIHGAKVLLSCAAEEELDLVPGKEGRLRRLERTSRAEVWVSLRSVGRSMARPPLRIEDLYNMHRLQYMSLEIMI